MSEESPKKIIYKSVTFEIGEFEARFPEIAAQSDLNESDKIRVALGLPARRAKAGARKGNKNAIGNKGRWKNERILS